MSRLKMFGREIVRELRLRQTKLPVRINLFVYEITYWSMYLLSVTIKLNASEIVRSCLSEGLG